MPFSRPAFTGFPFDDSDFDERDQNRSFRSTLDDIAKRHPEFAEHLNFDRFPFRSNTLGHKRRGSADKNNRFEEFTDHFGRPSSSRFKEKFGFPFSETFDASTDYQPDSETVKTPKQAEESKPPQVPKERGRKPNPNIPQSSTVDLGQKQDPVCDIRGQRSMSAPPENRAGQRFVSSINIPINTDGTDPNVQRQQPKQQQSQQQSKSNERVIPIHVEGRDEPVIPKHANQTFSQPPPTQSGPNRPGFGTWKRDEPPYYTGESKFFQKDPNYYGTDPHFDAMFSQEHPNTDHHFSNTGAFRQTPQPQAQPQPQNEQQQRTPPPPPPAQQKSATPPPPQPIKLGPIEQIQCIQKDVLELMNEVEQFNGRPRDKQYLYLDEMLTRNLLKLDDVETEGKENIRQARKEAINCIQKCISILEAKAMANEQLRSNVMDVDTKLDKPSVSEEAVPLTNLEVSGVSRSGSQIKEMEQEQPVVAESEASEGGASEVSQVESMETEVKSTPEECLATGPVEEKTSEESVESNEQSIQENNDSSQAEPIVKAEQTKDKKKVKKKEKSEK